MTIRADKSRQAGLSLVELLVALGIGAFLIAGVVQVFISNKSSERTETSLARLQENGRLALDLITADIRQSLYLGCNTGDAVLTVMAASSQFDGVRGYERGASSWGSLPALPNRITNGGSASIQNVARAGTDVLSVQMGVRMLTSLTAEVDETSTSVAITDNLNCVLSQGSEVILSSCITSHLFAVTNVQTCDATSPPNPTTLEFDNTLNTTTSIAAPYDLESELMQYQDRTWYVADTGRDYNGYNVFALFRDVNGLKEEMIEGVEAMQVQFGVRVSGSNAYRFVDATDATLNFGDNWDGVHMVRIAVLLQTFERVRDSNDTRTYRLLATDIDAGTTTPQHSGGRAMRQVFTTSVAMRNTIDLQ